MDFEGGLVWGVKRSFREYIDSTPDGRTECAEGVSVTRAGRFFFPRADAPGLRFGGRVVFTAHQGGLRLRLGSPWVDTAGGVTRVTVLTAEGERVPIAEVELGLPALLDGTLLWRSVPTALSEQGTALFNDIYPPGAALDPITIRVSSNTPVDPAPEPT